MASRKIKRISTIALNTGRGACATNHAYPTRTPVLALDFGALSVLVTTSTGDEVTTSDLEFARQLAREAGKFARAVERSFYGLPNGRGVAA